jgi:hypothetical protein
MSITAHPVAPEEVMALLDGELSAAEAQAVSAHVGDCAECAKLLEQFHSTSHLLSRWNIEAVPKKLEDAVASLAAQSSRGFEIGKGNIFVRAGFWTWKQRMIVSGGTVAALLVVLAILLPALYGPRQLVPPAPVANQRRQLAEPRSSARSTVSQLQTEGRPFTDQQARVFQGGSGGNVPGPGPVTSSAPGSAADSNGLYHGLGDHADSASALPPMIARTVSLSIVVKDFAAARSSLDIILARHHGYSAQLNVNTPENAPRGLQASLRIPAPELSAAVSDIKTLGRVENESQSGEEVTQQHADLVARLKTSRDTEERFRTILQQRTGNVAEVLQVEQGIARVRGDIERMEAEQKALEHRVDFATVELQLTEEYKAELNPPATSVSTRIHNALVAGYSNASETLLGTVLFFAEYGPTLLIWLVLLGLPLILLWRRYRRTLARS